MRVVTVDPGAQVYETLGQIKLVYDGVLITDVTPNVRES